MLVVLSMALVMGLWAGSDGLAGPADTRSDLPLNRGVGQRVSNFTLKDVTSDRSIALYSFIGKKAMVVVFLGVDCPVGNLYVPRLNELYRAYHAKGVVFLGINSNAHETPADVARYVRENGIEFPVLKDHQNQVSDTVLAQRTCEVLLLDGFARIRYRGAIDDQYAQGKSKSNPQHSYLREALASLLANQPIKVTASEVAGCLLDRVEPKPIEQATAARIRAPGEEISKVLEAREQEHPVKVGAVTYAADVARIMQNKCQSCHRPGQVGPFSLLTYDEARKHAAMIGEVVDQRRMPPWHADPRYGHFRNDRSLSARERATLLAWVEQGAPLGNAKDVPPPRVFPEGWSIGKPDVVFEIPETYYVPAQGVVEYVFFRVPTHFTEDRWIQAAEAVPGDPSVVHHIVVFLIESQASGGPRRGGGQHFCGYAPGDLPTILPEGTAKRIPAGAELIIQVHYTPNGRVRTDRSKVGMIFAKSKVEREAYTIGIANPDLLIPPGKEIGVPSSMVLEQDARLVSFMPHMHLRGKDFKYTITRPGESPEPVLSVPVYDFGWQTYYVLSQPMLLPKGTIIDCVAHFDNTESNPYNPDPKKFVRWGDQTFEEMMIGYVDLDVPVGSPPVRANEMRPGAVRATQAAIQAVRRFAGKDPAGANVRRSPLP
jgi:peroxiredoxin